MVRSLLDDRIADVLGADRFRYFRRGLVGLVGVLAVLVSQTELLTNLLPTVELFALSRQQASVALLVTFSFVLVQLEVLATKVGDMGTRVREVEGHIEDADVLQDDGGVSSDLTEYVEPDAPLWLLQYSSDQAEPLVSEAIPDSEVYLLLKHPAEAVNPNQGDKIVTSVTERFEVYGEYEQFNVRFYRETASVRGFKFGDERVALGWYTFDREPEVRGHDNPVVNLTKYNTGYEDADSFFESAFRRLWRRSDTLEAVFDERRHTDERWAETFDQWFSFADGKRADKRDWIRSVSDHGDDPFGSSANAEREAPEPAEVDA